MLTRLWRLLAIALTVALVPLAIPGLRVAQASDVSLSAGSAADLTSASNIASSPGDQLVALEASAAARAAMTTTTTLPPATTSTLAASAAAAPVKAAPASTTTTAPAPTTTTTTAPAPAAVPEVDTTPPPRSESGKATWYTLKDSAGGCAHKTLPMGTVVTVTSVTNGRSVQCVVDDRGPYVAGWILDLHPPEFSQLADLGAGVISVTISW